MILLYGRLNRPHNGFFNVYKHGRPYSMSAVSRHFRLFSFVFVWSHKQRPPA